MTLVEIVRTARKLLNEDLDYAVFDNYPSTHGSFWTDVELVQYANMAQDELQNEIVQSFENYFVTATTLSVVADQEAYDIPSSTLKIIRLEDIANSASPQEIFPMSFNDKDKVEIYNDPPYSNGTYKRYAIAGDSFYIRPVPTTSKSDGIKIWYSKRIDQFGVGVGDSATISQIPLEFHDAIVWGIVYRAQYQQDGEWKDALLEFNRQKQNMIRFIENRQVQRPRKVTRTKVGGFL